MTELSFEDWELIEYETAMNRQFELLEKVQAEKLAGYLIFCTHPPVVTLGRSTKPGDVFGWQGKVVEVARGGRATYHGPSQLLIYPILNLTLARKGRRDREIVGYLRVLENSIVEVLESYGVKSQGRSLQKNPHTSSDADETGVWVGSQKIASLGIGVRKWVSFHGAAINLSFDSTAFTGMNPCGFTTNTMVSLEQLMNEQVDREEFKSRMRSQLLKNL